MSCRFILILLLALPTVVVGQGTPFAGRRMRKGAFLSSSPTRSGPDKNQGFEVDLVGVLSRELGRDIRWVHYEFNASSGPAARRLRPGHERPRSPAGSANGRCASAGPIMSISSQLAVRRDDARFGSLGDLNNHPQALTGTVGGHGSRARARRSRSTSAPIAGQTELYKELATRRIDAVYLDTIIHSQYLPRFPELRLVGPAENKGYYAIAFRKTDVALAADVDRALGKILERGDLRRVYQKWGIWNDDQGELREFHGYE